MEYVSLIIVRPGQFENAGISFLGFLDGKKKEIKGVKEVKRGNQCTKDTWEMSTRDKLFSVMFVPLLICSKPSILSGFGHLCVCEPLLFKGNAIQQNIFNSLTP